MERKMILFIIVLASIIFAVGGGSLTSAKLSVQASHDCKINLLEIKITTNGIGMDNTLVKVLDSKTGEVFGSATTDFNGFVNFTIRADNKYLVVATKNGYDSGDSFVDVLCKIASQRSPSQPVIAKEPDFYCTNLTTVRERTSCVFSLPEEKVIALRYVPEECNVSDEKKKNECIALYRVLETCRSEDFKTDNERELCIKPKLNLSFNINDDLSRCQSLYEEKDKKTCLLKLKENVFTLVKFRIYNLVYKAAELSEKGAGKDDVIDFMTFLANEKVKFNNVNSIIEKKAVVKEVKDEWGKFKKKIKVDLK